MKNKKRWFILFSILIISGLILLSRQIALSQVYTYCYVHIYDNDNFDNGAAHLIVVGPVQSTTLNLLQDCGSKIDWSDSIDSVQTGPQAWVILFSDEKFEGRNLFLAPNTSISDLDKYEMGDDISSIMIYDSNPYPNYQWLQGKL